MKLKTYASQLKVQKQQRDEYKLKWNKMFKIEKDLGGLRTANNFSRCKFAVEASSMAK